MMLLAIPLGAVIGIALGMLGAGGSVLVVPVLVYLFNESPQNAATGSLIVVTGAALAAGLAQSQAQRVCWPHAGAFVLPALPAIYAGTILGDKIGGGALIAVFALFMIAAAWAMWRRSGQGSAASDESTEACPPVRLLRDGSLGVAIGLLTGLLGVGGGFVIVPALALVLGLSMRNAVGTSLVIISATGILGIAVHLLAGRSVDGELIALLGAAMIAGAWLGVLVGQRVSQENLARGFSVMVAVVATYLLASVVVLGGPPA